MPPPRGAGHTSTRPTRGSSRPYEPPAPVNQSTPRGVERGRVRVRARHAAPGTRSTASVRRSTRTIAFRPWSVIHAFPSASAITPCGAAPAPSGISCAAPVARSSRPAAPRNCAVYQTVPSPAGQMSCGCVCVGCAHVPLAEALRRRRRQEGAPAVRPDPHGRDAGAREDPRLARSERQAARPRERRGRADEHGARARGAGAARSRRRSWPRLGRAPSRRRHGRRRAAPSCAAAHAGRRQHASDRQPAHRGAQPARERTGRRRSPCRCRRDSGTRPDPPRRRSGTSAAAVAPDARSTSQITNIVRSGLLLTG